MQKSINGSETGMTAKQQYEHWREWTTEIRMEVDKGIASFLLTLPVPMSYEVWKHLHRIKGDFE